MDLGDAKYTINLDDKATSKISGIQASMKNMGAQMAKTGAVMVAAGAAIVGGLFKIADSYTKAGDEVAKMSKRTGLGVEALSELRHAANLSGTSIDSIEKAVKRMSSTIEDAKDGLETYTRSFDKLGISIDDVAAMNPEEQFLTIAEALAEVEDATTRAALAQDFFGRAGTDLLPMLMDGKEGLAAMREEAHALNLVFDEESAQASEKFQDAITNLKGSLQGLGAEFIEDLTPTLTIWIDKVTDATQKIKDWTATYPELSKQLLLLGGFLAAGGAILLGLAALSRAIVAINAALVVMRALSGPKGWITLAAGIGIAAGSIAALDKMYAGLGGATAGPTEQFGMQIGSPEWEAEQSRILGLGSLATPSPSGTSSVVVNVAGSVIAERDLAETVRSSLLGVSEDNAGVGLA